MQTTTQVLLLSAAALSLLSIGSINLATAQILDKDPPAAIPVGGNITTLEDVDISIDPTDNTPLPLNGTLTINTDGITDYDINSLVPSGLTIIIDNATVTATNHPVIIDVPDPSDDNGGG